ncbi:DUSAM domain-containing protein [Myxococcus sp. AM010]|uniref:DUSAM domain-containing protein n=1 Tax=Myxococcus sp. AM010 TaxID=2745138 RepID=UPI0020D0AE11|nr:DUSAM domain-containing protein [Myxococcus sp. AM010]
MAVSHRSESTRALHAQGDPPVRSNGPRTVPGGIRALHARLPEGHNSSRSSRRSPSTVLVRHRASWHDVHRTVTEVSRRISNGSRRLSRTLAEVDRCRDAGNVDGARQLLNDVLVVEVVPHYQDILRANLAALDDEF